jgi:hypothetical protein
LKKRQIPASSEQGRYSKRTIAIAGIVSALFILLCIILTFFKAELAACFGQIIITLTTSWCVMFGEYTYNSVVSKKIDGPYSLQFTKSRQQLNEAIPEIQAPGESGTIVKSENG